MKFYNSSLLFAALAVTFSGVKAQDCCVVTGSSDCPDGFQKIGTANGSAMCAVGGVCSPEGGLVLDDSGSNLPECGSGSAEAPVAAPTDAPVDPVAADPVAETPVDTTTATDTTPAATTTDNGSFTAVSGDISQSVTSVTTPRGAPCGVIVTIEVADTVTVSTNPPNLVSVSVSGDDLTYSYNKDVLGGTSNGGIIIGIPAGQLSSINARGEAQVQVLGGFTSISSISASSNRDFSADLSSNTVPTTLSVSANAGTTIVGGNYENGSISSNGSASIQGNWDNLSSSGNGGATLVGDLTSPSFSGNGGATVYGNIIDGGSSSGNGGLTINGRVTSGTLSNSGNGGITAASCDNINTSGWGGCNTGASENSSFSISFVKQDTISEKYTGGNCGGNGGGWFGGGGGGSDCTDNGSGCVNQNGGGGGGWFGGGGGSGCKSNNGNFLAGIAATLTAAVVAL